MKNSLSEVTRLTGAKSRSIQLWADAGILQPHEETRGAGTGTHRLFPKEEVIIAALLIPLASLGVQKRWLHLFADVVRSALKDRPRLPTDEESKQTIERALKGTGHNFLVFGFTKDAMSYEFMTTKTPDVSVNMNPLRWSGSEMPAVTILDLNLLLKPLRD